MLRVQADSDSGEYRGTFCVMAARAGCWDCRAAQGDWLAQLIVRCKADPLPGVWLPGGRHG